MITRQLLLTFAPLAIPPLTYLAGYFQMIISARVGAPPHRIPCPMCHGTRAFNAFYEASFVESLLENALVFTALVALNVFPFLFSLSATRYSTRPHSRTTPGPPRLLIALVATTGALLTAFQWAINIYRVN